MCSYPVGSLSSSAFAMIRLDFFTVTFLGSIFSYSYGAVAIKSVCVAGGGPVGLYSALLLLNEDPALEVTILEAKPREWTSSNAYGIGLNARMHRSFSEVPGLDDYVSEKSAKALGNLALISRVDLSDRLASFLLQKHPKRCRIFYEECCEAVDFQQKTLKTSRGRRLSYDMLLACDGVNSRVRQQLVEESDLQVEHYIGTRRWKALHLPRQDGLRPMQALRHPCFVSARILPKYPDEHMVLMFWDGSSSSPSNVTTPEEIKDMLNHAKTNKGLLVRLMGDRTKQPKKNRRQFISI